MSIFRHRVSPNHDSGDPLSTFLLSASDVSLFSDVALMPRDNNRLTWSFIRLTTGETTIIRFFLGLVPHMHTTAARLEK